MSKFIPRKNVYDECERQQIAKAKSLADIKSAQAKIKRAEELGEKICLTADETREVCRAVNFSMEIEK